MTKEETLKLLNSGNIYDPNDPFLMMQQQKLINRVHKFNHTKSSKWGLKKRQKMYKEMFASIGKGCYFEPPLNSSWGCSHVHFGNYCYANFNLTLVDDAEIFVGDCVKFGPNCILVTANHPLSAKVRNKGLQYNLPIHIGNNCWFGCNVIVLSGVNVGDNCVIGAGSIVTKDIPSNSLALGAPAKVIRSITAEDDKIYRKTMPIPAEFQPKE